MKKQIIQELQSKGFRATKSRVAILELFSESRMPLDAENIKSYLTGRGLSTDLATIYRFLTTFIKEGILYKIEFGEGKCRYELSSMPHHHHVVCTNCGDVDDVEVDERALLNRAKLQSNFKIDRHHLEFFGLCTNCQ